MRRFKNKAIAKLLTRFPRLARRFISAFTPWESKAVPWTPVTVPLSGATLALVTTAGVHHHEQAPFDMGDPEGDPSFRVIDGSRPVGDLMITHDYYDHRDADRDINIVLPLERLVEFARSGVIGGIAQSHYSFMGHITGRHLPVLMGETAPEVARRLREEGVGLVLLTPG